MAVGISRQEIGISRQEIGISRQEVGISRQEVGLSRQEIGTSRQEIAISRSVPLGGSAVVLHELRPAEAAHETLNALKESRSAKYQSAVPISQSGNCLGIVHREVSRKPQYSTGSV